MTDTSYSTEQEVFWSGQFGDDYTARNQGAHLLASNLALFSTILRRTGPIDSLIEFGANAGLNIKALQQLLPNTQFSAIEINRTAVKELSQIPNLEVLHQSILDFVPSSSYDFVLIKGVLMHIDPESLPLVYDRLYRASQRYICIDEYYNPVPVEVPYRNHRNRLFKRDFAGEMMDRYTDLKLVDYGFVYHRDTHFSEDDGTWFLLEKC